MTNKNIKKTPPHRINKNLRKKLKGINTSAFVDVMARQFGYDPHTVLMDNVIPLNNGERLVSRAVTIRYLPFRKDFDEMKRNINKVEMDLVQMRANMNALNGAIQQTNRLINKIEAEGEEKSKALKEMVAKG